MAGKSGQRRMDNVDLRLGVYFLAIPILLLYGITLTGCLSGLPNVYVIQLTGPKETLRMGYFGLCATPSNSTNFHCLSSAGASVDSLAHKFDLASQQHSILHTALKLQTTYLIPLLIPAGIFFFLSLIPLTLLKRNLKKTGVPTPPKSQRYIRLATLALTWLSVAFALVAAVSIQMSTASLHYVSEHSIMKVKMEVGMLLQALQWVIFALEGVYAVGVTSIFSVRDGMIRSAGYGASTEMLVQKPAAAKMGV